MNKAASITLISSLVVGIAMLAIWLHQRNPSNLDDLRYSEHLLSAQVSKEYGGLSFNDTQNDTFSIYMNGDTLVIETPDSTYEVPNTTPNMPLPFFYTRERIIGPVFIFNMTPTQFHSVYKFPTETAGVYSFEVWAGTEPGNGGE